MATSPKPQHNTTSGLQFNRQLPCSGSNQTTFVQADTSSFKQVVQMLTGSSDQPPPQQTSSTSKSHIPPIKSTTNFKLYERRNSIKNLKISPLNSFVFSNNSPRKADILSPSILDFPSLVLSPVTPLIRNFDRSAEEKAIREKGFYLHRSPATTPTDPEPRLLPLFPVTSPRVPGYSSAAN